MPSFLFQSAWSKPFNHHVRMHLPLNDLSCQNRTQTNEKKLREILNLKIWSPAVALAWYGDEKRVQFKEKIVLIAIYSESLESPSFISKLECFLSFSQRSTRVDLKCWKNWSNCEKEQKKFSDKLFNLTVDSRFVHFKTINVL